METRSPVASVTAIAGICAVLLACQPPSASDEGGAFAQTLLQGLRHRETALETLQVQALLFFAISEEYERELREKAAKRLSEIGQASDTQVREFRRQHFSLVDLAYAQHEWRFEIVDLVNSGVNWGGFGRNPAFERDLPPDIFYKLSICDGRNIYRYDRSASSGLVGPYEPKAPVQRARGLAELWWHVGLTYDAPLLSAIDDPDLHLLVSYDGLAGLDGIQCHKLRIQGEAGGGRYLGLRLWIAPDLGYAVVRQEYVSLSGEGQRTCTIIVDRARDFVQVAPGISCPRFTQKDRFVRGPQRGPSGWVWTKAVKCLSLRANEPVVIAVAPCFYPFDAVVQDSTQAPPVCRGTSTAVLRERLEDLVPAIEPDRVGAEITAERARELLGFPQ